MPRAGWLAIAFLLVCVWTFWPPPACWRASGSASESASASATHNRWRLTVFAIYKNEGEMIEEWMDHYCSEGADHFVLVDNGSTDNGTVPARYASMITWIYDPRVRVQHWWLQSGLLDDIDTRWLLSLDMDEFAFASNPDKLLVDVLNQQPCTTSRIQMESYRFGDSGLKRQPASVRIGFVRRGQGTDPDTPKTIVRPERVAKFYTHRPRMRNPVLDRPHWTDAIQLNHYGSQTLERWRRVQMTRGEAAPDYHLDKPRDEAEFARKNRNEVFDPVLASRVLRSRKARLAPLENN